MSVSDQTHPTHQPPAPPADGMTWGWLAYHMRLYGSNFMPPPHLRGLSLAYVEAKAREEGRAEREAKEAKERARRVAETPSPIDRALLGGPPAPATPSSASTSTSTPKPVQTVPARRDWRLRVRFLNELRRCGTFREAAARVGVDESTMRRWRRKLPGFRKACEDVIGERHQEHCDDLKLRAGRPRRRPYFFRGKQAGEHVEHDDRVLMFLLKLEDGQRARAEAREERREQRAHELKMKELEIAARQKEAATAAAATQQQAQQQPQPQPAVRRRLTVAEVTEAHYRWKAEQEAKAQLPASAGHEAPPVTADSAHGVNGLAPVPADIAPPRIAEGGQSDMTLLCPREAGEVPPQGAKGVGSFGERLPVDAPLRPSATSPETGEEM